MVVNPSIVTQSHIDPVDLFEWARDNVDPADDSSMLAAADKLYQLNNNKKFIVHSVMEQLTALAQGDEFVGQSAQGTVHLQGPGKFGNFTIRTVIWTPLTQKINSRAQEIQNAVFSYEVPHDHNFSLLTIGHRGPGYVTDIYEYDASKVRGVPGEDVELKFLETSQLTPSKMIYFRPNRDVHVQHHPTSTSISLNLIGITNRLGKLPQYEFDVQNKKIIGLLNGNDMTKMRVPFKLLSNLGLNDDATDLLSYIAKSHFSDHIRSDAYSSLAESKTFDEKLITCGLKDQSPLVRDTVRRLLSKI